MEYFNSRSFGGLVNNNLIEFITIATLGDSQNFGDLTMKQMDGRWWIIIINKCIFYGGSIMDLLHVSNKHNRFVTIATLGNAQDFGDL